jgi:hypothetical protein
MLADPQKETLFDELDANDEFDPLEDPLLNDEDEDEISILIGNTSTPPAKSADTVRAKTDIRTDAEKIVDIFKSMPTHRKTLLGILEFCIEKQRVPAVKERIADMLKASFSIYSAADYCNLLEQAGAILRVTEDGTDYTDAKTQPVITEEDGLEYLRAGNPPATFWATTEEGRNYLEADDPLGRLRNLLESEPTYHPIYKQVLLLCSTEGGKRITELGDILDNDPLLQEPRIYTQRFVDCLEKCDALVWDKAWKTTRVGQLGLEEIERFEKAAEAEEVVNG